MATKNKQDCHSCEAESFSRNHYFTGKLMVERDFTDEQRYFMEKIRLHHQRLHGTGVVCGLQIIAHEQPCDDRYAILLPGSAVDCCGKDILVAQREVIDLYAFPAMQELIEAAAQEEHPEDSPTHRLQLCIKYRECPGEEIPVLYDECGCDDTRCAPNRILESYEIDLLVDPEIAPQAVLQPALHWNHTVTVAHAGQVFLHEATQRLYVLTADDAGILYQISTDNFAVEASYALGRAGLALAANTTGNELYVVVANSGGTAAGDAELWVFDVTGTQLATGTVRDAPIADSDNSAASLYCLADGRLLALFHGGGRLRLWDAGVADPATPVNTLDYGVDLFGLSSGSAAQLIYSAEPAGANAHRFDVDAADFAPVVINTATNPAVDRASRVLAVVSTAADLLLVLDATNNVLRLVDPAGAGSVTGTVTLAHPPVDAAISNGAHWAYVLIADGDDSYVQSVNLHRLRQGYGVTAATPIPVGDASQGLAITSGAERLFIPYVDDLTVDNAGGVAVMDIDEANCRDLLWPEDCPGCETSDCLVLATIENYRPGFRVLDLPVPAPDATADLADSIARINNQLGRKRLPSTQAMAQAIECILDSCCTGSLGGEQGPPGLPGAPGEPGEPGAAGDPGADGRSISQVEVTMVPCDQPAAGQVTEIGADELLLSLEIPGNCNPDLAHLCNINWWHNGLYTRAQLFEENLLIDTGNGLFFRFLIRFDKPVLAADLNRFSIRVMVSVASSVLYQTFELHTQIEPGVFGTPTCALGDFKPGERINGNYADGAQILIATSWLTAISRRGFIMRFSIHGDFIRNEDNLAADLNHLPLWLTNQDATQPTAKHTGDSVPGGEFISWFTYQPSDATGGLVAGTPAMVAISSVELNSINEPSEESINAVRVMLTENRVPINRASFDELVAIKGIGPELAEAIVSARSQAPIKDEAALMKVSGIGKSLMSKIRKQIIFDDGE